jgi:hypothetical protein
VVVDAIPSSSQTEAIVRATIAGETTNLKFLKSDTGWTWEFVETKGGEWIAPDLGIGQVREADRQRRIVDWVRKNQDSYRKTIEVIGAHTEHLSTTAAEPRAVADWLKVRTFADDSLLARLNVGARIGVDRKYVEALISPTATDARGSEVLVRFADDGRRLFQNNGPDKQLGTDDDIICSKSASLDVRCGGRVSASLWVND